MNVLIINGHQLYPYASGKLNSTIHKDMSDFFKSKNYSVKETLIANGYNIKEEQEKILWSDLIIFQFPVYWFSVPAPMKQYMQDVYEHGLFYKGGKEYGRGGLLTNKKYMVSTTWNSPISAFGNGFWEGIKTPDDVLIAFHKTQEFIGLEKLPSFSCHDVVINPKIDDYRENLKKHLQKVFS